jgi:hypothetical protein
MKQRHQPISSLKRLMNDAKTKLVLNGHDGIITGIFFNSDGSRIATGSWDRSACVSSLAGVEELVLIPTTAGQPFPCHALTPEYLSGKVLPFLRALSEMQRVFDETRGLIVSIHSRMHSIVMNASAQVSDMQNLLDSYQNGAGKGSKEHVAFSFKIVPHVEMIIGSGFLL